MQEDMQTNVPHDIDEAPEGYNTETVDDQVALMVPTSAVPTAAQTPAPRPGLGGLIRAGLLLLAVLILLIVVSAIVFSVIKGSHNQPLSIDVYPNASVLSSTTATNSDHVMYQSDDPIDNVYDFYSRRLGSSEESGCKKLYLDAVASDLPGHYYYRCVVDLSVLEVSQLATLTLTSQLDANGVKARTLIDVSRNWGGS